MVVSGQNATVKLKTRRDPRHAPGDHVTAFNARRRPQPEPLSHLEPSAERSMRISSKTEYIRKGNGTDTCMY